MLNMLYGNALGKDPEKRPEAVVRRCSVKNVFLEISQNSQGNTSARVSYPGTGVFL